MPWKSLPTFVCTLGFLIALAPGLSAQDHSVARQWNEEMLNAIRNDFARPTVHARNLYHVSAAMYDCWSLIYREGSPSLMGTVQGNFSLDIETWQVPNFEDKKAAAREAVSFAAYRMLYHRYQNAPRWENIEPRLDSLMNTLGYDKDNLSTDYRNGGPAELGNYVAGQIIAYGLTDGANEINDYENVGYPDPVNVPLEFSRWFSIFQLLDPNHWQTLAFPGSFVDQSGNVIGDAVLPFLGASWGQVVPFALSAADRRDPTPQNPIRGNNPIYHDPGPPPFHQLQDQEELDQYRWGFELVLKWSSHLDPADSVMWDISPGALGNFQGEYPTDFADYPEFYKEYEGGIFGSNGRDLNPVTGEPYPPNIVPRGDYARVLAEFWADGPDSETPPGHWFAIFNKVMDHPLFERKFRGQGPELDPLEYDVKAYLALGGTMHDAAITAWSIKGAYDYIRPISVIRWLAKEGQASDPDGPRYTPGGIRYDPGYIERLMPGDTVASDVVFSNIKAWAWKGPDFVENPETDVAGVGWIDPINWMPYQRPNFVTPNFAGYISGHSTYSSAAATALEKITGSPYFPGGVGEFVAKKNEFLVFEEGPSVDVVLQWATYRDASDETSLSRIWGGIHPPVDDVPGRIIGMEVGDDAFDRALEIFNGNLSTVDPIAASAKALKIFPNPVVRGQEVMVELDLFTSFSRRLEVYDLNGRRVLEQWFAGPRANVPTQDLPAGTYYLFSPDDRAGSFFQVY
jgi:hypothetical protein